MKANGGCDDLCVNAPGSFSCACSSGFMLLLDGRQCKDVDECSEAGNPCSGGKCINTPGGYSCVCSGGLMMGPDGKFRITSCQYRVVVRVGQWVQLHPLILRKV